MNQSSQPLAWISTYCRQKYNLYPVLALLAALFTLSACTQNANSSTSKPTAPASADSADQLSLRKPSFDPCALFSKSDAARVLDGGVDVKADPLAPICNYDKSTATSEKGPQGVNGASQSHSVLIVSVGTSEDTHQYLALDRMSVGSQSQVKDVSGLGDGAFEVTFATGRALIAAQGNSVLSLGVFYPSLAQDKLQPALEQLARSALKVIASGPRSLPAPQPHPCQVITAQEASRLLQGKPVKWFFTANDAGSSGCDYIAPEGMQHRVVIGLTTDAHSAASLYANAHHTLLKSQGHDVKNLGDAAFYDGQNTIWILKGRDILHVTPFGFSVLDNSTMQLLHTAVDRL